MCLLENTHGLLTNKKNLHLTLITQSNTAVNMCRSQTVRFPIPTIYPKPLDVFKT